MRRRQKTKTVAIIALTISVLGLTLGFAAFSNVLTISSSATVTPDASDFKIALYGLPKTYEQQSLDWDDPNTLSLISSPETASPIIEQVNQYPASGSIGIIDGTSIKNLRAEFTGPDISVEYPIIIKNEGKYDAYANLLNFALPSKTCTAGEGATLSLVEAACENIEFSVWLGYIDKNTSTVVWSIEDIADASGNIKLGVGESFVANILISYKFSSTRADGPFSIAWTDMNFGFTSNIQQ